MSELNSPDRFATTASSSNGSLARVRLVRTPSSCRISSSPRSWAPWAIAMRPYPLSSTEERKDAHASTQAPMGPCRPSGDRRESFTPFRLDAVLEDGTQERSEVVAMLPANSGSFGVEFSLSERRCRPTACTSSASSPSTARRAWTRSRCRSISPGSARSGWRRIAASSTSSKRRERPSPGRAARACAVRASCGCSTAPRCIWTRCTRMPTKMPRGVMYPCLTVGQQSARGRHRRLSCAERPRSSRVRRGACGFYPRGVSSVPWSAVISHPRAGRPCGTAADDGDPHEPRVTSTWISAASSSSADCTASMSTDAAARATIFASKSRPPDIAAS